MSETVATLHPVLREKYTPQKFASFPDRESAMQELGDFLAAFYEAKCEEEDPKIVAQAERVITLQSIDTHWMDHIDDMSHLREQVAFSGYAQRDPLIEYKDQGFRRFRTLIANIESTIIRTLLQADFAQFAPRLFLDEAQEMLDTLQTNEGEIAAELEQTGVGGNGKRTLRQAQEESGKLPSNPIVMSADDHKAAGTQPRSVDRVGRNDPCPCGSGKKYKKCHGQ